MLGMTTRSTCPFAGFHGRQVKHEPATPTIRPATTGKDVCGVAARTKAAGLGVCDQFRFDFECWTLADIP